MKFVIENELVANKYLPFIQPSQTLTPVIGAGNFFQMSEHNYAIMELLYNHH